MGQRCSVCLFTVYVLIYGEQEVHAPEVVSPPSTQGQGKDTQFPLVFPF